LRPVRIPAEVPTATKPATDDSQDTALPSSPPRRPTRHRDRINLSPQGLLNDDIQLGDDDESQSPVRAQRFRPSPPLFESDEELQDIPTVLEAKPAPDSTAKLKRVKPAPRPGARTGRNGFQLFEMSDDEDDTMLDKPEDTSAGSCLMLSPPRSRGGVSSQDVPVALYEEMWPHEGTPENLPTPFASSEIPTSKRPFQVLLGSSDSDTDIVSMGSRSVSPSSGNSSNDEYPGVHEMGRRIKGVLPASWLRLDMKQQQKSDRRVRAQHRSPTKDSPAKGVAKPIKSSRRRTDALPSSSRMDLTFGDLDSSSEDDAELVQADRMSGIEFDEGQGLNLEVVEDNAVDAMLTPRTRKPPSKPRQRRLQDVWQSDRPKKSRHLGRQQQAGQIPAATDSWNRKARRSAPSKKVKGRHSRPPMTILDAPGLQDKDIPQFLRIATRLTRTTRSAPVQDLSKKLFKFANPQDTEDVNEAMSHWKARCTRLHHKVSSNSDGSSSRTVPFLPQPHGLSTTNDLTVAQSSNQNTRQAQGDDEFDLRLQLLKQNTAVTLQRLQEQRPTALMERRGRGSLSRPSPALANLFPPRTSRFKPQGQRSQPLGNIQTPAPAPELLALPHTVRRRVARPARLSAPSGADIMAARPAPQPKPTFTTLATTHKTERAEQASLSERPRIDPDVPTRQIFTRLADGRRKPVARLVSYRQK
jgi:hypothetical protein